MADTHALETRVHILDTGKILFAQGLAIEKTTNQMINQ